MMTIHKLTAGDGYLYLTRQVAGGDATRVRGQSAAEFYSAHGNPPGRWMGGGCAALGLTGEVVEAQMKALFGLGLHPDADAVMATYREQHVRAGMTPGQLDRVNSCARRAAEIGRPFMIFRDLEPYDERVAKRLDALRNAGGHVANGSEVGRIRHEEARRQRKAVAGFDLVFTPVKSVSLLWALDERPWVRNAVQAAHDAARDSTLALLEKHAALTRTGPGGTAQIETTGLIAAVFDHADSRRGDPNLHTHVAVSSKVLGVDGRWRALDARALYRIAVAASEHYNTRVEVELSQRLGVTFTPRPDAARGHETVREITGISPRIIDFFSARRGEIAPRYADLAAAYRQRLGREPALPAAHELAQQATLETRERKKAARAGDALREEWRATLLRRFGPDAQRRIANTVPARVPSQRASAPVDVPELAQRVIQEVEAARATWTRWNVLAQAERLLRTVPLPGAQAHDTLVPQVVDRALAALSIRIDAPSFLREPASLRRADGEPVFAEHAAQRYTSRTILDAEARLLDAARLWSPVRRDGQVVERAIAAFEADAGRRLDAGQRALVRSFATDRRALVAGIGPAGSGKTTAMCALAHAVEAVGSRVLPLATSANAAALLGAQLGLPAENVHKFLYEYDRGFTANPALRPVAGDVILIDEAGMAGTLQLDRIVELARQSGAVVRLLGDHRQLGAVASGGALRLIAHTVGAVELTTLHRFADPAHAAATLGLRVGDTHALRYYADRGHIRHGSARVMGEAAYQGWKRDMLAGKTTLMAAATNASVTELADRARRDRVRAGQVEPGGVRLRNGSRAGSGDWIVTRANDRMLRTCAGRDFVKNGDAWRVLQRRPDGALLAEHLANRGRVLLPPQYVGANVELLYATTAHRAQGLTVDTAHPLITPGMSRESLYVLGSRARESTTFYVATDASVGTENRAHTGPPAARAILEGVLRNDSAQRSATETIRRVQDDAASLATLVPQYIDTLAILTGRPKDGATATRAAAHEDNLTPPAPWAPADIHDGAAIPLPPWLPIMPATVTDPDARRHLNEFAVLIRDRVTSLTDTALTAGPSWLEAAGPPPENPVTRSAWLRHVTLAAAYRDQHRVTTSEPALPLGPAPAPGHPNRAAFDQAASSIAAARRISKHDLRTAGHPPTRQQRHATTQTTQARRQNTLSPAAAPKPPDLNQHPAEIPMRGPTM